MMRKLLLFAIMAVAFYSCNTPTEQKTTVEMKNEAVENIMARRTIRSYKPEQIQKEQLDTILKCAINAPSARNQQPWELRVIQNPELLKKINESFNAYTLKTDPKNEKVKQEGFSIFYDAPTLIVVAKDKANPFGDFDCGLLTQNVLLSAKSMGIGSVCLGWLSMYMQTDDAKEIATQFNIPDTHEIKIIIGLGYPNETPEAKPREAGRIQFVN